MCFISSSGCNRLNTTCPSAVYWYACYVLAESLGANVWVHACLYKHRTQLSPFGQQIIIRSTAIRGMSEIVSYRLVLGQEAFVNILPRPLTARFSPSKFHCLVPGMQRRISWTINAMAHVRINTWHLDLNDEHTRVFYLEYHDPTSRDSSHLALHRKGAANSPGKRYDMLDLPTLSHSYAARHAWPHTVVVRGRSRRTWPPTPPLRVAAHTVVARGRTHCHHAWPNAQSLACIWKRTHIWAEITTTWHSVWRKSHTGLRPATLRHTRLLATVQFWSGLDESDPSAIPLMSSRLTSSWYLSNERRRAFMKKFATVETFRPSCSAIVACISLLGRFVSLNIASRVRRCMSVNTRRGFFGAGSSDLVSSSFRLHAGKEIRGRFK